MNIEDLAGLGMWQDWKSKVEAELPNFAKCPLYVAQGHIKEERFEEVAKRVAQILGGYCTGDLAFHLGSRTRDAEFGARIVNTDSLGKVTRMWLDSNVEIDFLRRHLPDLKEMTALDIGAGYGRLPVMLSPFVKEMYCTDAVPISTEICRGYCQRFAPSVKVLSLEEFVNSTGLKIDLAINVHSFNECPMAQIQAWINAALELGVKHLFLVDHGINLETSYKAWDNNMASFKPVLEKDFTLMAEESLGLSHSTHSLWTRKLPPTDVVWITNVLQSTLMPDGTRCGNALCNSCRKEMPGCWNVVCSCCGDTACYEHSKSVNNIWFCYRCLCESGNNEPPNNLARIEQELSERIISAIQ